MKMGYCMLPGFISYYPLKQGLKRGVKFVYGTTEMDLYPTIH